MTGNSLLCFSKQPLDIEMDNYSGLRNRSLKIDLFRLSSLLHSGSSGHPLNFWMTRAPREIRDTHRIGCGLSPLAIDGCPSFVILD